MPWRAICQFGSLESAFATLEGDMAIALFLSRTVPDRLAVLRGRELPKLPQLARREPAGVAAARAPRLPFPLS